MRIDLNPIGDPEMAQLFIQGKVFNLQHKTGNIYAQYNPISPISFKGDTPLNGCFSAVYDEWNNTLEKNSLPEDEWQRLIKFPEILFNGPIKDNAVLNEINRQRFREDSGFVVTNETLKNRLEGQLVILDLAGDKFFVDIRLNQLRSIKNFMIQLDMKDFNQLANRIWGWYDKGKKQMVTIDNNSIIRTPKNIYRVEFNDWFTLDPIGFARKDDIGRPEQFWNDAKYVNDVLMEVDPKANVKHISETHIAAIVVENRHHKGLPPETARIVAPIKTNGKGIK